MKKTLQFLSLLVITLISFTACENEPLEGFDLTTLEQVDNNSNTGNTGTGGTNTGGTLPSSTGTSEGDYFPRAINNEWIYTLTTGTQTQTQETKLINSFTDSGQTVFETAATSIVAGGTSVVTKSFIYKSGGDYYVYSSENEIDFGAYEGTQTAVPAYVFLKDNQPVGHSWSVSYSQTTSYTATMSGLPDLPAITTNIVNNLEIADKDLTVTVGTETFSPVIKVKSDLTSSSVAGSTTNEIFYYFAKDVGLIKTENTGTSSSLTELDSYSLF